MSWTSYRTRAKRDGACQRCEFCSSTGAVAIAHPAPYVHGWQPTGSLLVSAVAVGKTPDEPTGSVLRVGSEIGHLIRRAVADLRPVAEQATADRCLSERAAPFLRRLFPTTSSRSRTRIFGTRIAFSACAVARPAHQNEFAALKPLGVFPHMRVPLRLAARRDHRPLECALVPARAPQRYGCPPDARRAGARPPRAGRW